MCGKIHFHYERTLPVVRKGGAKYRSIDANVDRPFKLINVPLHQFGSHSLRRLHSPQTVRMGIRRSLSCTVHTTVTQGRACMKTDNSLIHKWTNTFADKFSSSHPPTDPSISSTLKICLFFFKLYIYNIKSYTFFYSQFKATSLEWKEMHGPMFTALEGSTGSTRWTVQSSTLAKHFVRTLVSLCICAQIGARWSHGFHTWITLYKTVSTGCKMVVQGEGRLKWDESDQRWRWDKGWLGSWVLAQFLSDKHDNQKIA